MKMLRFLMAISVMLVAVAAQAAFTLTVTSPTEGGFLGFNNQVKFLITNATEETTVRVTAAGPGGSTVIEQKFTPNVDNKIDGSIALSFNESSPSGAYTVTVEAFDSGFTAPPVVRNVTVDVLKPKILEFNPVSGTAVKGPIVPINVKVLESNLKEWRVKIDGNDIPNNTGTTVDGSGSFQVDWNVTGFLTDGTHTVSISVKDKSDNETTQSVSLRIDRLAPTVSITYPRTDSNIRPRSDFSVIIDITDPNNGLIDFTGVDVIIRFPAGGYLYRVPRVSFQSTGSGTFRWTGRVRKDSIRLPSKFIVDVTVVDRAGNIATQQQVTISTR